MQFSRISSKPSLDLTFHKWLIINDESINRAQAGVNKSKQMQGFATIGGSSKIHFAVGDPYADFQKDKPSIAEAKKWFGGSASDFRSSHGGDMREASMGVGEASRPSTQQQRQQQPSPPRTRPVVPPLRTGGLMGLQQQQQLPLQVPCQPGPPSSSTPAASSRPGSRAAVGAVAAALARSASAGELAGGRPQRHDDLDGGRLLSNGGSQTRIGVRIPAANGSGPSATSSYWHSYSGCRRGTTLKLA